MTVIDLTHAVSGEMPVYPGTLPPRLDAACTIEQNGFRETLLTMFSHTGTHMDAPAHLFLGGRTLDQFPASQFCGKALVVDCTDLCAGAKVPLSHVTRYGKQADEADFLLFRFGWDRYWGQEEYFGDFPAIGAEIADYVIQTRKKGIGVDTISVDPMSEPTLPIHKQLLQTDNIVLIENLKALDRLGQGLVDFYALPLSFSGADGAPVRAIGVLQ